MSESRPFGDGLCAAVRHYLHQNNKTHLGQINAEILADLSQRFYEHFQEQQKARKKKAEAHPEAAEVYAAYPRRVGRDDACRAIDECLRNVSRDLLLEKTKRYAASVSRWPASFRYKEGRDTVPYPATWFRAGRYADDEREWLPAGMFTREDDPTSSGRLARQPDLREPPGWRVEFPTSIFKEWSEVPQDSRKAICDHMNKVRA